MTNKCPCKKKCQSPAIICKHCEQWWHASCVSLKGLNVDELKKLTSWNCPLCYVLPDTVPYGKMEQLIKVECNLLKTQIRSVENAVKADKIKSLVSDVVTEHMSKQVETVTQIVSTSSIDTRKAIAETIQQNNNKVVTDVVKSSKAQMDTDSNARDQRKCNLVIRNVSEPEGATPNDRRSADEQFAMRVLNIERDQLIKVNRVGKPIGTIRDDTRISRPLIITVETPELASNLHDYGRGWRRRDGEGTVYWINPDLIKCDREANYNARMLARGRRQGRMFTLDSVDGSPGSHRSSESPLLRARSLSRESQRTTRSSSQSTAEDLG
jgi:hypothetical protein